MTHLTTGVPPCVAAKKEERERETAGGRQREKLMGNGYWVTQRERQRDRMRRNLSKTFL